MARSELRDNPDFLADCASDMMKVDIMEKYGCSSHLVVEVRKEIGGKLDEARAVQRGEKSDIVDGPEGKTFEFVRHRPITLEDARNWIRSSGDNPDAYWISIRSIAYGDGLASNRMSAYPKTGMALAETFSLDHLYAEAAKKVKARTPVPPLERATVVVIADMQLGKTGRRGGTPETLARMAEKREKLEGIYKHRRPGRILLPDVGDGIEGFESGGNPMFTNDMSLPDQLDCYGTEIYKFITQAHTYAPVDVTVVPSNHAAWRRGKQQLGNPSDDFGIFVHKQVKKVAEAAGLDATWTFPEEYDESVRVDLLGVPLGFVHGNQFGPGKAIDWWQAQAFGGQALTHCDVLVTGHYHSYGAGVAGTNPFTGNERMWLGAPTLDNGSDWFRQTAGRDSEPGILIFDVTPAGLDLSSIALV